MNLRRVCGLAWLLGLLGGCGSGGNEPHVSATDGGGDSSAADAGAGDSSEDTAAAEESGTTADSGIDGAADAGTPGTFNVFDHIPQFNMYSSSNPANYMPPSGVLMWSYGTIFVTQLDAQKQQALIGADLAARVTYFAQCDNYDRIGGVFFVIEPKGQAPQPTDPRIELVRFITPFSDYSKGMLATHVFPNGDLSAYANVLADSTHDIWIGIGGGSYPTYSGNPCTGKDAGPTSDFTEIGFLYSLDFVSTSPLVSGATMALAAFSLPSEAGAPSAISNVPETTTPIAGTFTNPGGSLTGRVTVIVSGHGSSAGGDEYEYTKDTVSVGGSLDGGSPIGSFSTEINCAPYAAASPDGNPGIFEGNTTSANPRNWCPGALVPSHTYPVTLSAGSSSVVLGISPSQVPAGSYYQTSITFTSP